MDPKLEELEKKIRKARHDEPTPEELSKAEADSNSRAGIQAGFEFVGSIVVSLVIGYGLDQWLGTKPVFFLIFFFLGICTGFFNVYRVTQNLGASVGFSQLHQAQKDAKRSPELNDKDEQEQ